MTGGAIRPATLSLQLDLHPYPVGLIHFRFSKLGLGLPRSRSSGNSFRSYNPFGFPEKRLQSTALTCSPKPLLYRNTSNFFYVCRGFSLISVPLNIEKWACPFSTVSKECAGDRKGRFFCAVNALSSSSLQSFISEDVHQDQVLQSDFGYHDRFPANISENFITPSEDDDAEKTARNRNSRVEAVSEESQNQAFEEMELYTGPPEGDTAGAVLLIENLTLSAGSRDLLSEANWRLMPGDRVGLVGSNGCGKSTFLRAIIGQHPVRSDRMVITHGAQLGYLEQTAVSGSQRTVWDEVRSRMTAINAAEAELNAAVTAVEGSEEGAIARLGAAQDRFEAVDGYKADEMIAGVLNGLGFQQSDWLRKCSAFSGGWQMRIALARLLLGQLAQRERSLLLLDEPTNHLDSKARAWLASYLAKATGAVIIVSHDEELLERACGRIAEIRGGKLHHYVGNYSKFLQERDMRMQQLASEVESKQAEMARLEGFITRFGAKATKAAAANSKKKALAKVQASLPSEAPQAGAAGAGGDRRQVSISLPHPPLCAREVLTVRKAIVGWEAEAPLMQDVDLKLEKEMRMVILGPNGCGKSTLLRALAGNGALLGGQVKLGEGVQLGIFTQDLAQDLPQDISGLEFVLQVAREKDPTVTDQRGRSALGALGLTGDAALRPIGALSGGEKARVALGSFVLRPYNCLLLDEASNHLDRPTVKALAAALQAFKGAIIAITHDQEFCQALGPTHVARVLPGGTLAVSPVFGGDFQPQDFDTASLPGSGETSRKGRTVRTAGNSAGPRKAGTATIVAPVAATAGKGGGQAAAAKDLKKKLLSAQSRIKKILGSIEACAAELAQLDLDMMAAGSDAGKAMLTQKQKDAVSLKLIQFEEEWEVLETEADALAAKIASL